MELDAAAPVAPAEETLRPRAEADGDAQRLQSVAERAQDPDEAVGSQVRLAGDEDGLWRSQLVQHLQRPCT